MKYKYKIVINGSLHSFSDNSFANVFSQAASLLKKNNINFSEIDLKQQIERQSRINNIKKKVTLIEAFNGARAFVRYVKGDSVSSKEMHRRSSICLSCPLISMASNCMSCGGSRVATNLINEVTKLKNPESAIPIEIKDKYCGVCSCSLSLMVVSKYKEFTQEDKDKNLSRPDNCWLKSTSQNFTNE